MPEHAVILIAEDEEDDVLLLRRAFSQADIQNPVHVVYTGKELVSYLKGDDHYADRDEFPLPDLLLLDLKLPGYNGFEVLAWIRSHPGLVRLRVLVLTSSNEAKDINDAYRFGANSFLVKPNNFEKLVDIAKLIRDYWLEGSRCPESFRMAESAQPPIKPGGQHERLRENSNATGS